MIQKCVVLKILRGILQSSIGVTTELVHAIAPTLQWRLPRCFSGDKPVPS